MKPITIIYGPPYSGKSELAERILEEFQKPHRLNATDRTRNVTYGSTALSDIDPKCDVVFVKNISQNDLQPFVTKFYEDEMVVEHLKGEPFTMKTPKLILTIESGYIYKSQLDMSWDRRYNLIEIEKFDLRELWKELEDFHLDIDTRKDLDLSNALKPVTAEEPV